MRLAALYLRSRLAGYALALLGITTLIAWAAGHFILSWSQGIVEYLTPVLVLAPLVGGCVVGVSARSPFGDAEHTVSRSLPALRFGHLAGLLAVAALAFVGAAFAWELVSADLARERGHAALALGRGLVGLSGLALLTAYALGGRLSWTVPVGFVAIIPLAGDGSDDRRWAWWAFVDQPADDGISWIIALALLAGGLALACRYGTRESAGEG